LRVVPALHEGLTKTSTNTPNSHACPKASRSQRHRGRFDPPLVLLGLPHTVPLRFNGFVTESESEARTARREGYLVTTWLGLSMALSIAGALIMTFIGGTVEWAFAMFVIGGLSLAFGLSSLIFAAIADAPGEHEIRFTDSRGKAASLIAIADLQRELQFHRSSLREALARNKSQPQSQVMVDQEQAEAIRRMFAGETKRSARAQLRQNFLFFLGGILVPIAINLVVKLINDY